MKLLLVDDDESLTETVATGLRARWEDAEIHCANDGEQGWRLFAELAPDLVVLDLSMPRMGGFDLLEHIRRESDALVLMLTGHNDEANRVRGLELGADDYLAKPFSQRELSARVKALLRRAGAPPPEDQAPSFTWGDLSVNFVTRQVAVNGQRVSLTPTEYRLLYELVTNAGKVLTADGLLRSVWGPGYENDLNSLKIYISRLRKKLGDDPQHPRYVLTERNAGYTFASRSRAMADQ